MSESHSTDFKSYVRRCAYVFALVLAGTLAMVAASFAPIGGWPVKVAVILAVACFNAFVVAGFLMHLISEKKMIYTLLGFTIIFFAGLMGLTVYAMHDMPTGTTFH
jgi:fatty acid desaturase